MIDSFRSFCMTNNPHTTHSIISNNGEPLFGSLGHKTFAIIITIDWTLEIYSFIHSIKQKRQQQQQHNCEIK
ncbi:hypothetical protein DERF_014354 [Dermatophagoides farinae]|uniref:Uncharacterized protein n=1 Tax=Dermatophagoides farinae TaxID=6954 RepID=A0A922KWN9_DERFA|nr:hypothetical protein DERF_014354 [Dermatophagoides farinae]